jgi:2-amino-4-hydroxy-6-hydroxymethyldihydropteridine diphosphokinase
MADEPGTTTAYVAVGSNVEPLRNVPAAVRLLARHVDVAAASTFYRTEPVAPPGEAPAARDEFVNGVLAIRTSLPPGPLKRDVLRAVEDELGRDRSAGRYGPRTIDLDLVLFGRMVIDEPALTIPSRDLDRPFVAIPLRELAPDLVLPHTRQPLSCLWGASPLPGMVRDEACTRAVREVMGR